MGLKVQAAICDPASILTQLMHRSDVAERPAFVLEGTTLTYGDVFAVTQATADRLHALGLSPGDRVLLLFPNCVEHITALLAVTSLGGVAVPLDPDSGAARLAHVIGETSPRLVMALEGVATPPDIERLTCRVDVLRPGVRFAPEATPGQPSRRSRPRFGPDAVAVIRYSSGTTGVPKGVPLTHRQVLWTAQTLSRVYGLDANHRDYVTSPLAHSGSWQRVAMTLASGGTVVLAQGPLSISVILEDIESHGVTGFYMAPPLLRMLLRFPPDTARQALRSCRSIESGSAPLSAPELRQVMDLVPGARVFFHYGLTECSRAVILDARAHPDKLETVGRPTPGVELRIGADDGRPAGVGQSGQIFLRGPQLSTFYWNQPDLTAERFAESWFSTGDYGMLDEDGFLTYLGRRDDLITSAAYSFFPAEVETELGPVEGVAHYVVAGVPDPAGVVGEVPWAFVVPASPQNWGPRDFLALARDRLPSYMVPRMVITVPSLALTSSGKPDRRRTVELYAPQGSGRHDKK